MKGVTIFYTPGTGLPDFEMRIALGLCGAALNSVKPEKIRLIPLQNSIPTGRMFSVSTF
mgnify:CR=1 FL=1